MRVCVFDGGSMSWCGKSQFLRLEDGACKDKNTLVHIPREGVLSALVLVTFFEKSKHCNAVDSLSPSDLQDAVISQQKTPAQAIIVDIIWLCAPSQ